MTEQTTVIGVEPVWGRPYTAELNIDGEDGEIVLSDSLLSVLPVKGAKVMSGPAGWEIEFDPARAGDLYVWLVGNTDVVSVEGPELLPEDEDGGVDEGVESVVY